MCKFLKIMAVLIVVLLMSTSVVLGYFLLVKTGPPPKRPELVRVPPDAPPPPRGYPTENAVYLAYFLGLFKPIDPAFDWPVPGGVVETKDIEYGRVGDRALLLDLYRPEKMEGPAPGLIFIHGGGWYAGDKRDYKYYTVRFAERGFVVATIGYRYSDEAPFPGCVEDAKCAVRWMRAHAEELNIDPQRIAAIGGSAGGHLSMMAGYSSDVPELEGTGGHAEFSSRPDLVVNLYGPTDATVPELRDNPIGYRFLRKTYEEDPELYRRLSPLYYVDPSDPPTLVIHGTVDSIVPVEQADLLVEKFIETGVPHWYARLDGLPHTMDIIPEVNEHVQWLMLAFFETYFGALPTDASTANR